MRTFIFIFSFFLTLFTVNGQAKQEVIASAGGFSSSSGVSLSWTLGETLVPSYTSLDGTLKIIHGFQQQVIVTTVEENIEAVVTVKVFPNPASDVLNIRFESPVEGGMEIILLDSNGRLVKRDVIEDQMSEKQLNLQDVPGGVYYLRLNKGKLVNVYKVVKL